MLIFPKFKKFGNDFVSVPTQIWMAFSMNVPMPSVAIRPDIFGAFLARSGRSPMKSTSQPTTPAKIMQSGIASASGAVASESMIYII